MDEKTMVTDALVGINGELKMFGDMIAQTENQELKQCLKQIRNQAEMSQETMYELARRKSYYIPAVKASPQEIEHVKSILSQPQMR
ncbi:MAG: spore coat protein [Lacrimispora saccharolytica]